MTPHYIPIYKAKSSEFDATRNLKTASLQKVRPIFEIPAFTERKRTSSQKYLESSSPMSLYLNGIAEELSGLPDVTYHIDINDWPSHSSVESGEHIMSFLYRRLIDLGCALNPVVSYLAWDDPDYRNALEHLPLSTNSKVIIRLENEEHEDLDDPDHFLTKILDILNSLSLEPHQCGVLIDFSDISDRPSIDIQETIEKVLSQLVFWDFEFIAMAGSSMPLFVSSVVTEENSDAVLTRKEVNPWKALRAAYPDVNLVFGDYAVRNPDAPDYAPNPNVNGKIRYTIPDNYYIIRGHSMQKGEKGRQYHELARLLVRSPHYKGPEFSWGDKMAYECSTRTPGPKSKPGNPTKWLSFDTNHHTEAVLTEVFEFITSVNPEKSNVE